MDDIRENGVGHHPAAVIVHGKGYSIIGGERRAAAWLALGNQHVTLYVVKTWREYLAWLLIDAEHNHRHDWITGVREPMNLVDAAWWTGKVRLHLETRKFDAADQVLAEYVGHGMVNIRNTRYALRWLQHSDPRVRDFTAAQLKQVADGTTAAGTIGTRISRFVESLAVAPVARQRAVLSAASGQLAGLADALRGIIPALTDELTDDEIDAALKHFQEGRLQAERVIRTLRAIKENRK